MNTIGDEPPPQILLLKHNLETNHDFNFKASKIFVYVHNKQQRKIVDSNIISNYNTINQWLVFFK